MINMQKLYILSRTIHRIFVLVALTLILVVGGAGGSLKYPEITSAFGLDAGIVRYVHNTLSGILFFVLMIMASTGIVMYVYPWWARRQHQ